MRKIFVGIMAIFVFGVVGLGVIKVAGTFSKAQAATACIITLFGKQYDVTALQTAHTGGNLYACGTDMSATYQAKHGTDVTMMIPYLVAASTPTPTPTSAPLPTSTPAPTVTPTVAPSPTITQAPTQAGSRDDDDEDEIEEEEHEVKRQVGKDHREVKGKRSDHSKGHHLVGVNSAHGIMDNTFKKDR